jgi:steroid delta-isomerase-like uncharacterized protein
MRRGILSLCLGLACFACQAESQSIGGASHAQRLEKDPLEQQKTLVRRWIEEGFNQRRLNVVEQIFAERFFVNGLEIGREGLRKNMSRHVTAFPDLHVTITDVVAEGSKVVIWYTVEGTHRGEFEGVPPTNRHVTWTGVDLLRVSGGRIVEARFLSDSLGLLRQLGSAPPGPARK